MNGASAEASYADVFRYGRKIDSSRVVDFLVGVILTHGLVILCSWKQSSEMRHHCLSFPVSRFEAMPSVMS